MRPLRVVHLVEALGTGGLERVVQALVRHADVRRFAVEVLCAVKGGAVAREIEMAGARVRILGVSTYGPRGVLAAARAIRETEADLVHTHGHFAGVVGRAAAWWTGRAVAVHHLHTVDPTLEPRHLRRERFLLRVTRRVLCCSQAVARHAARDLGAPPHLLAVIPNGIDPPPPAGRAEALDRLGLKPDDGPIVGCVGGLSRHKGQSALMHAMGQLDGRPPRPTLVLVGDGPDRPGLESEAATLQGRVRIRFMGERPDARSLLPAFDVLVVPSIEREGFGLAALEGMDAGLPVVASRLGGLPEVVEDGRTGLLVPPGDVRAMALAIARLLANPEERRAMGTEGRRRVESRFRAAPMARRVESVYEEVLGERRAA